MWKGVIAINSNCAVENSLREKIIEDIIGSLQIDLSVESLINDIRLSNPQLLEHYIDIYVTGFNDGAYFMVRKLNKCSTGRKYISIKTILGRGAESIEAVIKVNIDKDSIVNIVPMHEPDLFKVFKTGFTAGVEETKNMRSIQIRSNTN